MEHRRWYLVPPSGAGAMGWLVTFSPAYLQKFTGFGLRRVSLSSFLVGNKEEAVLQLQGRS